MNEELYQFLACDYFGTGEGRTVMLLITRAYPRGEDYETLGDFVDGKFVPGTLKNSAKFRAAREFVDEFGGYYAQGAENLSRAVFLERFGNHLPAYLVNLLEDPDQPGNLNFKQSLHLNFS